MKAKTLKRVFNYDGKKLSDPDPNMTTKEVLKYYSSQYPELLTSNITGEEVSVDKKGNDIITYEISRNLGTKG